MLYTLPRSTFLTVPQLLQTSPNDQQSQGDMGVMVLKVTDHSRVSASLTPRFHWMHVCCVPALVRFFTPLSGKPHHLHFESSMAQHC